LRRFVRETIERLPESYRVVLILRDLEELSTEETAAMLGATTNAVKIRLHRARQALRTMLDPYVQLRVSGAGDRIERRHEIALAQGFLEAAPFLGRHFQRYIDVEAEARGAVENHRLCSEEIPSPPVSEDGCERGQ